MKQQISRALVSAAACVFLGVAVPAQSAAPPDPPGLVAVSAGQKVALVAPATGAVRSFESGPVGWLYPAPGGLLFAPDLVHAQTLVIDLRKLRIAQRLKGVTMPHFGAIVADRYITVAGDVMVLSYPERAMLARIPAHIMRPWQVAISEDWSTLFILERTPGLAAPPVLWTVDLTNRDILRKTPLDAGIVSMAFSRNLGLLAFADGASGVLLADPVTLKTVRRLEPGGTVRDVAFANEDTILLAAVARNHRGTIETFRLKVKRKGLSMSQKKPVVLEAAPLRLAVSPDGLWAVAATARPGLSFFKVGHSEIVRTVPLPATPRDVEWCDVTRRGPLLPEWSDLK